jgi:hypothetical protein
MSDTCPACNASLLGVPVPEKYLHHNIPGDPYFDPKKETCEEQKARNVLLGLRERCFCLPYGEGTTHFSRRHGVEVRGVYDGVLFWVCPDCNHAWHRWEDPHVRRRAQPYIDQHNARLGHDD